MAEHHAAQPRRIETLVVCAQSGGAGPQLFVRIDGETCNGARKQQLRVEHRGFGQIGQQRTVPFDAGAAVDKRVGHPVYAAQKLEAMRERAAQPSTVHLGMPDFRRDAGRLTASADSG